jgi:hypothetical protein
MLSKNSIMGIGMGIPILIIFSITSAFQIANVFTVPEDEERYS